MARYNTMQYDTCLATHYVQCMITLVCRQMQLNSGSNKENSPADKDKSPADKDKSPTDKDQTLKQ